MNIPPGTILQLGRGDSSYPFQNIIATNIQGSDYVDGFPTTSTGTSLGQYFHLGIDGQDNKKTDMLNVSGTYTGGFNFWTSNSTDAPILLADITKNGISIVKTTGGVSYETFGTFGSGTNYFIMDHPPVGPPTNWVLQNMYIVQVGNSTATLSTGVNYNVKFVDTQVITFHTTSDPNSPVIDSTGVLTVLVPYGSSPVISSSTNLNDTLIITDFVNTSTLSKIRFSTVGFNGSGTLNQDSVVVQDTQNNRQSIQYAFETVYQNNAEGKGTSVLAPLSVIDNTCFQSTGTTSSVKVQVDTPRITSTDGTDVSILTATDLTFNAKSILPTLSSFDFTIDSSPYSFPFVSTGELTPQSSFSITTTASSITLITPNISTDSLISATIYRDRVFSPLEVSLTTNSIVLTGDFSDTSIIYFSGFIFLA